MLSRLNPHEEEQSVTVNRRDFLILGSGLVAGAACVGTKSGPDSAAPKGANQPAPADNGNAPEPIASPAGDDWAAIRAEFDIDPEYMNFTAFKLAPHPRMVREAIDKHRRELDRNPTIYLDNRLDFDKQVRVAAGEFLGAGVEDIALTDSTTMGLGLLYGGFLLRPGQELVCSTQDHYATRMSLRSRAQRGDTTLRQISLYEDSFSVTSSQIVERLLAQVTPRTRLVATTWVHSFSGVKLPIRAIADALAERNRNRDEADRAILCVDGVQGMGVERFTVGELGCDFFVAGTHKWLFGPRGTGLVWGEKGAWQSVLPTIPPFEIPGFIANARDQTLPREPGGLVFSPGGYHSFEHRWALAAAFEFQKRIGRERIEKRTHTLCRQLKEGLLAMKHVKLHTPMAEDLSAGFVMFEVAGMKPKQVVKALLKRKIIGSTTPYQPSYARLAPSLLNDETHVEAALRAVRELA